jgi:excisionase family DNA binding protein
MRRSVQAATAGSLTASERKSWQCAHHAGCGERLYTVAPVPLCQAHGAELNRTVRVISTLPTLDQLAADPRQASELSTEALAALATRCAAAHGAIASAQAALLLTHNTTAAAADSLLTVEQAAERLGVTKDYLYRAAKTLDFAVRLGPGQLRFSSAGIDQYIQAKMARNH